MIKNRDRLIEKMNSKAMTETMKADLDEMKRSIQAFQPEDALFEVRTIPTQGSLSKHCCVKNNEEGLNAFFKELESHHMTQIPLYMTLQAVKQDAKCFYDYNKIVPNNGCVKDADIIHYQWIYIDIDPEHPTGTQATEQETAFAKEVAEEVKKYLEEQGFPHPIYSFTGNGYSLNYPTEIKNTKENAKLVNSFLKALKNRFSTEHAQIDTTTGNPARISKVIGCLSCKGKDTPDRPYRTTRLLDVPDIENYVTEGQLQNVIDELAPVQKISEKNKKVKKPSIQRTSIKIRSIEEWLDSCHLAYRLSECEYNDKPVKKFELEDCPFNEHDNHYCSAVIQFENENAIFKCFHDHCQNYTIYDMIKKYPIKGEIPLIQRDDKITQIYNEVISNCKLIISDENQHYILTDKNEVVQCDSSEAGDYIVNQAQKIQLLPSKNMITTIKTNMNALYDEYASHATVAERAAFKNNTLYYALSQEHSVMISDGTIIADSPLCDDLYFHYSNSFSPQCNPDFDTPATALPELVKQTFNISEEHMLSFLAQLVCFFMPHINTPLLVLSGGQGTSKSTTARKIKALVDPASVDIQTLPDKLDSLYIALSDSYLVAFDNIEKISDDYSAVFCIACTGGVAPKRKLFTDNEKVDIRLHTRIILNGIGDIISKNDLAERTNIIYLDSIQKRRTEAQVWKEFNELKPKILGAIFNCIKGGLGYIDEMTESIKELPRMADFCIHGAAFIKAMGLSWNDFVKKYQGSTTELIAEQTQQDEFTMLLQTFLAENDNQWSGEPVTLLAELKKCAVKHHFHLNQKQPNVLTRKLNQSEVSLKSVGIFVNTTRGKKRKVTITKKDDNI